MENPVEEVIEEEVIEEVVEEGGAVEASEEEIVEEVLEEEPQKKKKLNAEERTQQIKQATWEKHEATRQQEEVNKRGAEILAENKKMLAKLDAHNHRLENPKPSIDNYSNNEEYVEAITDWKVEEAMKSKAKAVEPKAEAPNQENDASLRDWNHRRQGALDKYTDFEQNEAKIAESFKYWNNQELVDTLVTSAKGPQLIQHLGKNRKELERIAQLSARDTIKELGKLEDRVGKRTVKKTSTAPAPTTRVSGGGSGTINSDVTNMNTSQYMEYMNKQGF